MIGVSRKLYEAKDPIVTVEINDESVLTITDNDGKPVYILELKVVRRD